MAGQHRRTTQSGQLRKHAKAALMAVKVVGALVVTVYWCWKLWILIQQQTADS
ncbi:hypothetical protein [Streptomyces tsukubensis]|uniref:hypothetical protein n=1 Tax=Streptomyces tsukubensis TaxID=83656 RepID=UPI00344C0D95